MLLDFNDTLATPTNLRLTDIIISKMVRNIYLLSADISGRPSDADAPLPGFFSSPSLLEA